MGRFGVTELDIFSYVLQDMATHTWCTVCKCIFGLLILEDHSNTGKFKKHLWRPARLENNGLHANKIDG